MQREERRQIVSLHRKRTTAFIPLNGISSFSLCPYLFISLCYGEHSLSLSLSLLHVPLIAPRLRLRAPPLTFTSHRLTYEPLAALFQPPPIPRLHRLRNVISNVTLPPLLPNLDHLTSVSMLLSFRDPQPKLILVAVDEREGISEERKIGRKIYTYIYAYVHMCGNSVAQSVLHFVHVTNVHFRGRGGV